MTTPPKKGSKEWREAISAGRRGKGCKPRNQAGKDAISAGLRNWQRRRYDTQLQSAQQRGVPFPETYELYKFAKIRYNWHRGHAKEEGTGHDLTFEDWWGYWARSGKWDQRGPRKGQYCMARFGDIGRYQNGNVYISLSSENSSIRPQGTVTPSERKTRSKRLKKLNKDPKFIKARNKATLENIKRTAFIEARAKALHKIHAAMRQGKTHSIRDKVTGRYLSKPKEPKS